MLNRLSWLDRAIGETRQFCESIEADAAMERGMASFGSADYDSEIDLNNQAKMSRETLALMEKERRSIIARDRARAKKRAAEE